MMEQAQLWYSSGEDGTALDAGVFTGFGGRDCDHVMRRFRRWVIWFGSGDPAFKFGAGDGLTSTSIITKFGVGTPCRSDYV